MSWMSSAIFVEPGEGSVTGVLSFMFIQTSSCQNGLKIILYGLARRCVLCPAPEIQRKDAAQENCKFEARQIPDVERATGLLRSPPGTDRKTIREFAEIESPSDNKVA